MKKLLITAILLFQVAVFYGETAPNGRLGANAIDKISGHALEYVAVTLLDASQNYVKGFLSTVNGYFSIEGLAYGDYFLKIGKTGYEDTIVPLHISQDAKQLMLGPVTLQPLLASCIVGKSLSNGEKECK